MNDQKPELQIGLCDLQTDPETQILEWTKIDFWKTILRKYRLIIDDFFRLSSMFSSTCICENVFSKIKLIKIK